MKNSIQDSKSCKAIDVRSEKIPENYTGWLAWEFTDGLTLIYSEENKFFTYPETIPVDVPPLIEINGFFYRSFREHNDFNIMAACYYLELI